MCSFIYPHLVKHILGTFRGSQTLWRVFQWGYLSTLWSSVYTRERQCSSHWWMRNTWVQEAEWCLHDVSSCDRVSDWPPDSGVPLAMEFRKLSLFFTWVDHLPASSPALCILGGRMKPRAGLENPSFSSSLEIMRFLRASTNFLLIIMGLCYLWSIT